MRTRKQLDRVLDELDGAPGIVLYTLLDRHLADPLEEKCRALGLPYLSILDPVLQLSGISCAVPRSGYALHPRRSSP